MSNGVASVRRQAVMDFHSQMQRLSRDKAAKARDSHQAAEHRMSGSVRRRCGRFGVNSPSLSGGRRS